MKLNFKPASKLETFGLRVFNILTHDFPQTFFVGGMVRDLLVKKKVIDVDIATQATPDQIMSLLKKQGIIYDDKHKNFGVVIARSERSRPFTTIEITTFRSEIYNNNRYPSVKFVISPKQDSKRRDFTINAFYFSPKQGRVYDFHAGAGDIKHKYIRFIGQPARRIKQDPLRILRALRFALALKFRLESKTKLAIKNNFFMLKTVSQAKLQLEIRKLSSKAHRAILAKVINSQQLIDKYF